MPHLVPVAISLSRQDSLPPLIGLAPQQQAVIDAYRQRESVPFPVFSVDERAFIRAISNTPLLMLVEADTIRNIFPSGSIPTLVDLNRTLTHAP